MNILEIYTPLIPFVTLYLKRRQKSEWINLLIGYLLVYLLLVYSANHFFHDKNNNIVYIILSALTFSFFALIFGQYLLSRKFRIFNRIAIASAILFFVANAVWWEGTSVFNSYSSGFANLVLVGYCLYYYKLQLEKPQIIFVEQQPSFWIVSGIFVYSAGNLFLFSVFSSLTRNNPDFAYYAWDINVILTLIMNIFFAKGIQCSWPK